VEAGTVGAAARSPTEHGTYRQLAAVLRGWVLIC